jgi:hypothetical protein
MKIARFRQPAMAALAVLLISGAGIAFAGNRSPAAPAAAAPAAPVVAPAEPTAESTAEPVEPVGADTDTLQVGDQTTPDTAATQAAPAAAKAASAAGKSAAAVTAAESATEKAASETETTGAEEPGDANLPGGGHADDPNDPNADHQNEGVE